MKYSSLNLPTCSKVDRRTMRQAPEMPSTSQASAPSSNSAAIPQSGLFGQIFLKNSESRTWLVIVGNDCTQLNCSVPSEFMSLQPTVPASGSEPRDACIVSIADPTTSVSGLRKSTHSPDDASNARLLALAKPRFSALWTNRTCG